ncbi:OLC1v1023849C2 [Oldenlandia corymbosa var. corymbosa]|nr:OLC1v1023849C2 [Oldenlandia corymbosa var. corymbosa]
MNLPELTSALPISPSKSQHIHRLIQFLVTGGFFVEPMEGYYSLTQAGKLFLSHEPFNLRPHVYLAVDPVTFKSWNFLTDWFKTDDQESPFEAAHGKSFWDYIDQEPQFCKYFYEVMSRDSSLMVRALLHDYKFMFEGLTSLVDVGGGIGTVARELSATFPSLECVVFDLPHVVSNQKGTKNLSFLAGSMFETIPSANAVLLKWILHDWSDENCVKILKNCKRAIPAKEEGGKVFIIEDVVGCQKEAANSSLKDMTMMVLFNGKERTPKEWTTLFSDAGFNESRTFPVLGTKCIIELYP